MRKIKTVEQLKAECMDTPNDFFISLNGGFRSSKNILFNPENETFEVINEIDGTFQTLSENKLYLESNIGTAITEGAFYIY